MINFSKLIYDPQIRELFINFVEKYNILFDDEQIKIIEFLNNTEYSVIDKDAKLKLYLLSVPEYWILFLKDKDFLIYIKDSWQDLKSFIQEFNYEDYKDNMLDENLKNIDKINDLMKIFSDTYPEIL